MRVARRTASARATLKGIDVFRTFGREHVAGGHQDTQCGAGTVDQAGDAQLAGLEVQRGEGHAQGIEWIGFPHPASGFQVTVGGFGYRVSGSGQHAGEDRPVGGCSFDHPEGGSIAAGTAASPGQCSLDSPGRGWEVAGFEVFPGAGDDGLDVLFRVGVDADDVGVCFRDSLRDDSHAVRCSLDSSDRAWGRVRPVPVREESPRRSNAVMGHTHWGGQASNQATVSGPGSCRPPTTGNRQFTSMTPCGSVTNRVMFTVTGRPGSYLAS